MDVVARIERIARRGFDERQLRVAVLAELRSALQFDVYAWLLTDPLTTVGWSPVAEVPELTELPDVIRAKYLTTVNRWTELAPGVAATLVGATGGDRSRSLLWRRVLSRYAIEDVASVVFRDRNGCWGFLDLWRREGQFGPAECALLGASSEILTPVLRRALLPTFTTAVTPPANGPAVLLLGEDLRPVAQTAPSEEHLRALLPAEPGRSPVPAAAYNVAAQLCAVEAAVDRGPPEARIFVPGRSWMTVRAARIDASDADGATIVVSIDAAAPAERSVLYGAVAGLTGREHAVLAAVVSGQDTRGIAGRLAISEHTVQDHLKSIFAKTGSDSRRMLAARATGASDG